ncbi:MAG: ligase-associated DNA damage response endonuclease PdeM [Bacteroidetes bacterium]|nr:ligase-associated DNA damage response endonuclease PdeM [Bacteroidota bacterium]
MVIIIADEKLELFPEKAIYWEKERILFISDTHFGKTSTFRIQGIPVPAGGLNEDLKKITSLLNKTKAEKIYFLGDLFHSRMGKTPSVLDAVINWRENHKEIEMNLIRGNHDYHAGDPCEELDIKCYDEPFDLSPFVLKHEPEKSNDGYVLCGHIHPSIHLYGKGGSSLKAHCFYFTEKYAVLPAFGDFTGTYKIRPAENDRVFAVADDHIFEIKPKVFQ